MDVAVSTPRVLAALVEEAVEVGDIVRLFTFRQGQANLIEVTLPEGALCAGAPVRDLLLPDDSALVAIVRDQRVIAPTPEEPLEPGDELLFVVSVRVGRVDRSVAGGGIGSVIRDLPVLPRRPRLRQPSDPHQRYRRRSEREGSSPTAAHDERS